MNRIEKNENGLYILHLENGEKYECKRWLENKPNKQVWHIVVPKEAREICGRTYIRESYFDEANFYEFENKIEHREGLGGGGWRSRLNEAELAKLEEAEKTIEELKEIGKKRAAEKPEKDSIEYLEAEIAKMMAKLAKKKAE